MKEASDFQFWMDWGIQFVVGVGTLLVAATAIFGDAIKAACVRLSVTVGDARGMQQPYAVNQGEEIPARWYHLRVTNEGGLVNAHGTTVWLLEIDNRDPDNPVSWRGEMPLTWQHQDMLPGPRVIRKKHPMLADLVAISSEGPLSIQLRYFPIGLQRVFAGACELWMVVQARCDESSSPRYRVHFKWDGTWDGATQGAGVQFNVHALSEG